MTMRELTLDEQIDMHEETLHTCAPTSVKEAARKKIRELVAERDRMKVAVASSSLTVDTV